MSAAIKKVGVLGGGQLGRMLAEAGIPMGLEFIFYDKNPAPCAGDFGRIETDIDGFTAAADIYTYEFENADHSLAQRLAEKKRLFPSLQALETAASRSQEKTLFKQLQIDTARWRPIRSPQDLQATAKELGFPFVIKTNRLGYDGKGQTRIDNPRQLAAAIRDLFPSAPKTERAKNSTLQEEDPPFIAEEWIKFKREFSQISARDQEGGTVHYPPTENTHKEGILYSSRVPTDLSPERHAQLKQWVEGMMQELDYVGVLALEVFDCGEEFIANEFAPRVHNSGHWTIEGAVTSQFENHLRAICGMPVEDTSLRTPAILMLNLIGATISSEVDGGHTHLYNKQIRPGRKVGHITFTADSMAELDAMRSKIKEETFITLR